MCWTFVLIDNGFPDYFVKFKFTYFNNRTACYFDRDGYLKKYLFNVGVQS